jgi:hypothetical protein
MIHFFPFIYSAIVFAVTAMDINILTYLPSCGIPIPLIFPQGLQIRPRLLKGPNPTQPTGQIPSGAVFFILTLVYHLASLGGVRQ